MSNADIWVSPPDGLRDNPTAEALRERIELDPDAIAAVQPPRGYGRD